MNRIAIAALLGAGVLAPAVTVAGVATGAGAARADVSVVSLPTAVTVDGATVRFSGTVRVAASASGLRSASLWFRYPDARTRTLVGTADSRSRDVLTVTGRLDARRLTPGLNEVRVVDDVDGGSRTIVLDLRRRSRVSISAVTAAGTGRLAVAVRTRHYDARTATYVPSRLSPVRVQEMVDGRWVTVGTGTTDRTGAGSVTVEATAGAHVYRVRRPDGATVTAATSTAVTAVRA